MKLKYGTVRVFTCVELPAPNLCTIPSIKNDQPKVKKFFLGISFNLKIIKNRACQSVSSLYLHPKIFGYLLVPI